MTLRRAAIVSPIRTGVGKFMGSLASVQAGDLGGIVIKAVVERTGIDPERIDDVVFAQGYGNGEAPCIGRWSALAAGLPESVPGVQLDRRCGSGLQAVIDAAMRIQTGAADLVIAGGVESMSNVEYYSIDHRTGARAGSSTFHDRLSRGRVMSQPIARYGVISGMIETAENLARDYAVTREACDAYAVTSHQRAAKAWAQGKFDDELVPVPVPQKRGDPVVFATDEGIRADATPESLAALKPLEKGGVVTAGNASQQNDAAAACLVVAEEAGRVRAGANGLAHRLGGSGMRPVAHGHRPGARGREAVRAHGARLGRYWARGVERSLRAPGAGGFEGLGLGRSRPVERQRLGHQPWSPDRGHGRADPCHAAARDAAPGRALRARDHVHRRRPGPGRRVRARLAFCAPAQAGAPCIPRPGT